MVSKIVNANIMQVIINLHFHYRLTGTIILKKIIPSALSTQVDNFVFSKLGSRSQIEYTVDKYQSSDANPGFFVYSLKLLLGSVLYYSLYRGCNSKLIKQDI